MNIHTVILAAGEGSRMLSTKAKSLQPLGGHSMLKRIYDTASKISHEISFVVGYEKESIIEEIKNFDGKNYITEQKKAIGTADAVKASLDSISNDSKVIVLYGDVPLIKENTLKSLISNTDNSLTILSTKIENTFGYGRIKKDAECYATAIVEE